MGPNLYAVTEALIHADGEKAIFSPLRNSVNHLRKFELGLNLLMMPMNHGEPTIDSLENAKAMRQIGVERCVMDTDCGQVYSPSPVEAMRYWIAIMLKCDMTPSEIEWMVCNNLSILLDLPSGESNGENLSF